MELKKLIKILKELRQKCPWDMKQTNETLRYLTMEECYELSDAILAKNDISIKEELGDILLHVLFYALIGEEKNKFTLNEVISSQIDKLITRHPHVYGNVNVSNEKDVKRNWELIKLKNNKKRTLLSGVPKSLPAMLKSYRVLEKVRGLGFEFSNKKESFNKIVEEFDEFKIEIKDKKMDKASEEFGDFLFALIGHAQSLGINAVNALESTNIKFISRFNSLEDSLKKQGKTLSDCSHKNLHKLWDDLKNKT